MLSGDGLLVRIKPAYSQLTALPFGLAELADKFGNGRFDLTSRANLQIIGVSGAIIQRFLPPEEETISPLSEQNC